MTIDAKVALPLIGDVLKEALPVMGELVKAIAPLLQPFADAAAKKIAGDEESASKPIEFSLTPEPEKDFDYHLVNGLAPLRPRSGR